MRCRRFTETVDLELPELDADEALIAADLLDAVLDSIWQTYGEAMNERLIDLAMQTYPEHNDPEF